MFSELSVVLKALSEGKMIVLVDDEDRENEGDFVMAAEFCSQESVSFMLNYGRGLICVPMEEHRAMELSLPLMVRRNEESMHTQFTVSCDLRFGISTGISAEDRSKTIRALANVNTRESDLVCPGHIFPLIAHTKGLKARRGHTEASIELCRQAGLKTVAVICEILDDKGKTLKKEELLDFCKQWSIPFYSIEKLIQEI